MTGIASAAIMGGMALAGSVGSGLIAQGGAGAAAGQSAVAAQNAAFQAQQAQKNNRSDLSPWMATGTRATGQLGALLGYGSLWNRGGDGATYGYEDDPNAQANAQNALRSYMAGSGATMPNYVPVNALTGRMTQVSDNFAEDPSYQWRFDQGQKALDRSAASKGMLLSGAQGKALQDYGQGAASQEYASWYNRLLGQNQFNFGLDQFNAQANQQNFNQQQQLYANQYGAWRDAIGDVQNASGQGMGATNALAGMNSQQSTVGGNALLQGGLAGANATQQGANSFASGIGSGVSNALSAYYLNNYLNKGGTAGGGTSIYGYGTVPSNFGAIGGYSGGYQNK